MTVTTNKIVTGAEVGTGVTSASFLRVNAPLDYTSHSGVSSVITVVAGIPGTVGEGGGGDPAPEDYLVDLNGFADKAAALAFYAADGVTISDVVQTLFVRDLILQTDHVEDPYGGVVPNAPAGANPTTPYLLYVSFAGADVDFTVTINPAMQIKYFSFDFWNNDPAGVGVVTSYSGGESKVTVTSPGTNGTPLSSTTITAPAGLAAASYLTTITFTLNNCRMAWDNMLLKVA